MDVHLVASGRAALEVSAAGRVPKQRLLRKQSVHITVSCPSCFSHYQLEPSLLERSHRAAAVRSVVACSRFAKTARRPRRRPSSPTTSRVKLLRAACTVPPDTKKPAKTGTVSDVVPLLDSSASDRPQFRSRKISSCPSPKMATSIPRLRSAWLPGGTNRRSVAPASRPSCPKQLVRAKPRPEPSKVPATRTPTKSRPPRRPSNGLRLEPYEEEIAPASASGRYVPLDSEPDSA